MAFTTQIYLKATIKSNLRALTVFGTLLLLLFQLTACSEVAPEFTVKKELSKKLSNFSSVYIESRSLDEPQHYTGYIADMNGEIFSKLTSMKINPMFEPDIAPVEILCTFSVGTGMPRPTLHFNIIWKYLDIINIKVIDTKTKEILGEAEYVRPYWHRSSPSYVQLLMDMLENSGPTEKIKVGG